MIYTRRQPSEPNGRFRIRRIGSKGFIMKIRIICVGRLKEKFYTDAVNEFRKRLGRFAEVEITELADERAPEGLSPAELEQVKAAECSRILEKSHERTRLLRLILRENSFHHLSLRINFPIIC